MLCLQVAGLSAYQSWRDHRDADVAAAQAGERAKAAARLDRRRYEALWAEVNAIDAELAELRKQLSEGSSNAEALERVRERLRLLEQRLQRFQDDEARLYEALAKLPEDQREALRLRYVENLPSKDIAERLGKSDGSVRVMLTRALSKLQQILGPDDIPR